MRTTFNINFYCRDSKKDKKGMATVEMGITLNGSRVFINLPMKSRPEEFNRKRKPAEIEEQLSRWRTKVNAVINELMDEGQALTATGIRDMLRTGGSYRKYELVKEKFLEYIRQTPRMYRSFNKIYRLQ